MPQELSDAARATLYLELYKEQCAHGRHIEGQRQTVSAMLLTAAGALIGLIGAMKFGIAMLPVALCVLALGILGRGFLTIFAEKWEETSKRRRFIESNSWHLATSKALVTIRTRERFVKGGRWYFPALSRLALFVRF